MIKSWLQLFRAQTFSATLLVLMIGFLLGGGDLFSVYGLLLLIFAWMMHTSSFGDNSLMDAAMGYDQHDPSKKHHPLITGAIKIETAHNVVHTYVAVSLLFGIVLIFASGGHMLFAMASLLLFVIFGTNAYNKGLSKTTVYSFLPISICFTALMFYAYFLAAKELSAVMVLAGIYLFFTEWYEQGVEGYIKDIKAGKEKNMMRHLGARCNHVFDLGGKALIYSWIVKIVGIAVLGAITFGYNFNHWSMCVFILMMLAMVYFAVELTKKQVWNRHKLLRNMAMEEVCSVFALPLVLIPLIDGVSVVFLLLLSLFSFALFNKINWNTVFAPKV